MSRLTISIPDQMNELVEAQINAGRYGNVGEYFCDLVRRDQERRELSTQNKSSQGRRDIGLREIVPNKK